MIGEKKFAYDIWGATVNIASRMESHGAPGCIHVSRVTADRLGERFKLSPRGAIDVKGTGLMKRFFSKAKRVEPTDCIVIGATRPCRLERFQAMLVSAEAALRRFA